MGRKKENGKGKKGKKNRQKNIKIKAGKREGSRREKEEGVVGLERREKKGEEGWEKEGRRKKDGY